MAELPIDSSLIGRDVCNAARPEWGVGKVASVQPTPVDGKPAQRVTIEFPTGRRTLVVPPARLVEPRPEPQRGAGWLDVLGKSTLDDQLRQLPEEVTEMIGTPRQRVAALAPLYRYDETPAGLSRWACDRVEVADPLSQWSRDELQVAFRVFSHERDGYLRSALAILRRDEGPDAVKELLDGLEPTTAARMRDALQKPL